MSTTCSKDYAITVSGVTVDAYWTLDESGTSADRIDEVNGVAMTSGFLNQMTGAPALFGNGIAFTEKGTGSGFDTGGFGDFNLRLQSTDGFSMFGWFKVLDWPAPTSYGNSPAVGYDQGAAQPIMNVLMTFETFSPAQHVTFYFLDNNTNTFTPADFIPALNTWYFFHVFYDPVVGKCGYSINNGTKVYDNTPGATFAPNASGVVGIGQTWALANTALTCVLLDEFGFKLSSILTDAEVAYLYNNGIGRTWPL